MRSVFVAVLSFAFSAWAIADQAQTSDYNRDTLQPLTKFRQQHRRTVDGRLCAAAFVQNRKAYTGCTDAANPSGESGRPWCYVEPQVRICVFSYMAKPMKFLQLLDGSSSPWNYCGCFFDNVAFPIFCWYSICSSWRALILSFFVGRVCAVGLVVSFSLEVTLAQRPCPPA